MEIFALCVKCGSRQRHPVLPATQAAQLKRSHRMRSQPVAAPSGPEEPLFVSWHQFAMNRGYLPFRIDKHERTVQAVRTTVGGALHAAQIDGDPIPRRRRTNFIKMSRLRLNRLGRVLGEDRLLEGGVKSRTVGEFQPEWITGNQRLAERHQAVCLRFYLL